MVVDCSVAAKWELQEPGRPEALHLLDEQESGEILLIAPDLLLIEFASLIAKRVRRAQMPATQAYRAFRLMEESELRWFETRPLLGAALDLALNNQMSLWILFISPLPSNTAARSSPRIAACSVDTRLVIRRYGCSRPAIRGSDGLLYPFGFSSSTTTSTAG
jgi:predicted nucleic acid-binding protein